MKELPEIQMVQRDRKMSRRPEKMGRKALYL